MNRRPPSRSPRPFFSHLPFVSLALLLGAGCTPAESSGNTGSGGSDGTGGRSGNGSGGSGSGSGANNGSGGANGSGGSSASGGSGSGSGGKGSGGSGSGGASSGSGGVASGGSGSGSGGASSGSGGMATGGMSATGGASGGGSGGSVSCTITPTVQMSTAIPTVAGLTYTTTLAGITGGEIQFGLPGGAMMVAPIDTTKTNPRTLLLGMKGGKMYTYKVVLKTGSGSCSSAEGMLMTGAVPSSVNKPTVAISMAAAHDKGFIVTSGGLMGTTTEILDADGEVVWWATGPAQNSRSHMSWDGQHMYMMALNVQNSDAGKVISIGMDGAGMETASGTTTSHHDLTAIPGGFATPLWNSSGMDAPCSIVEFADGTWTKTVVVADVSTIYNSSNKYHTNGIHYYDTDKTYTLSDRNPNLFVKISRSGSLIWQFGGTNPKDMTKMFTGVMTWQVNHGHHLLADGTFLFFNNNANEAWGYKLDTTKMTAMQTWKYTASGSTSMVLGDVQGLPNGNMLVTFSNSAQIHEVTPAGQLVMKITATSASGYGYSEFRESLYGPPPY